MPGKAATAKEYLAALPEDRRKTVEAVRKVILKHLPKGYKESVGYGVLTYAVPLETLSRDVQRSAAAPSAGWRRRRLAPRPVS